MRWHRCCISTIHARPASGFQISSADARTSKPIEFLRQLNEHVFREFPGVHTIAEESTAWPMVSKPTYIGGLGFGFKWDMGWMHDTLKYMSQDAFFRKYHHHELTFRMIYAFTENFMLPLSHDEVVHGKGSLIGQDAGR